MRKLEQHDLDWLVALAKEFNDKLLCIPLNISKTRGVLSTMIEHGVGFRSEHGAIIGTYYDDPMRDKTVLVEIGWYCTDKQGIRLLRKFIEQARIDGADEVRMSTLEASKAAEIILGRHSFNKIETSHSLRLD